MKTLVLGLGNTLLKDDGVAIKAVQELDTFLSSRGIDVKVSGLSGLALIDEILGYDLVFIIDAVQSDSHEVAEVFPIKLQTMLDLPTGPSPHFLGIPAILRYCRLFGLNAPRQIKILGIEVEDPFSFDENLSQKLRQALPDVAEKIKNRILKEINDVVDLMPSPTN